MFSDLNGVGFWNNPFDHCISSTIIFMLLLLSYIPDIFYWGLRPSSIIPIINVWRGSILPFRQLSWHGSEMMTYALLKLKFCTFRETWCSRSLFIWGYMVWIGWFLSQFRCVTTTILHNLSIRRHYLLLFLFRQIIREDKSTLLSRNEFQKLLMILFLTIGNNCVIIRVPWLMNLTIIVPVSISQIALSTFYNAVDIWHVLEFEKYGA